MFKKLISVILCIALMLSLTSCGGESIASVNGKNIDKAYFDFYFNNLKLQLEAEFGIDNWVGAPYEGKTALEYAKERALQSAIEDKIVMLKSDEYSVSLSEQEKENMKLIKNQYIEHYGGKDAFISELLKTYNINEKQFDYMLEATYLKTRLANMCVPTDDDMIADYYMNDIAKVKHILIFTINPQTGEELPEEELLAATKQAEHLLKLAKTVEDFDALVAEYTDDQDVFYYVGKGFRLSDSGAETTGMVKEFETACFELAPGQVSEIVKSTYGYHIIKRYEGDTDMYIKSKNTLESRLKTEGMPDILNDWKSTMKIVVNESLYNSYK